MVGFLEGRQRFFFEKKNQKTFAPSDRDCFYTPDPRVKSLLRRFFSKKWLLS
jgi:hypothetical protein